MTGWADKTAPSLDEFEALAREAFNALPTDFRAMCGDVAIMIADLAEADVLADFGMESPFELTGLYEGTEITRRSIDDIAPMPARVFLYRLAILAEWMEEGDITLRALVRHVLVHEIGHHFGLSDEDMHRIEEA